MQIYMPFFCIFIAFRLITLCYRATLRACLYVYMYFSFSGVLGSTVSERDDVIVVFSIPLPMVECFYMLPEVRYYYDM